MGLDSIIDNDKEYKSTLNYILINNNVCKTMKEINYIINKNIDDAQRRGTTLSEELKKNKNYQIALENKKKNEEKEKKEKEERKSRMIRQLGRVISNKEY